MRDESNIADQVSAILTDLDELKTAQLVGHSQVKVTEYASDAISVTSTTTGYTSEAFANCTVMAGSILPGNILITHCVPEVYASGGVLIDNKTDGRSVNVTTIETDSDNTNAFQINIYHTSTGGETIPAETYTVKFHIYSTAALTLTAQGGVYGSNA